MSVSVAGVYMYGNKGNVRLNMVGVNTSGGLFMGYDGVQVAALLSVVMTVIAGIIYWKCGKASNGENDQKI